MKIEGLLGRPVRVQLKENEFSESDSDGEKRPVTMVETVVGDIQGGMRIFIRKTAR